MPMPMPGPMPGPTPMPIRMPISFRMRMRMRIRLRMSQVTDHGSPMTVRVVGAFDRGVVRVEVDERWLL